MTTVYVIFKILAWKKLKWSVVLLKMAAINHMTIVQGQHSPHISSGLSSLDLNNFLITGITQFMFHRIVNHPVADSAHSS